MYKSTMYRKQAAEITTKIRMVHLIYLFYVICTPSCEVFAVKHNEKTTFHRVLFQGDIVLGNRIQRQIDDDDHSNKVRRELVTGTVNHWPKFGDKVHVSYTIDGIENKLRTLIKDAMRVFQRLTCLKFVPRTKEKDYITLTDKNGCYSFIGRQGGQQDLSLGRGCHSLGTVLHEIMHTLGFFHEQSRPDRDKYVKILFDNIETGQEPQFNIIKNGLMATANEPYDLNSLMHYKNREFSKNGLDTIQSRTDPNLPLGNYFLSKVDVLQINKLLDCPTRYWDVTEYSITVYTTNILWAGTDANVFLEIRNKKGDSTGEFQLRGEFEAGNKDMNSNIIATRVDLPGILNVRHDNSGYFSAWHLEKVVVKDMTDGKKFIFVCNCWLQGNANVKFLTLE